MTVATPTPVIDEDRRLALTGAAQAFCNRGMVIAWPWEGELDAEERQRFEALVAAIESYNALMPPEVKPLKWQKLPGPHYRSYDGLLTYHVSCITQDGVDYWRWSRGSGSWSNVFPDETACQAAAQADYAGQILATIVKPII